MRFWIVEGAIDAAAVYALVALCGVRRVAALGLPGVASWSQLRAGVLTLARDRVVVVATDADKAGDDAAKLIAADLAPSRGWSGESAPAAKTGLRCSSSRLRRGGGVRAIEICAGAGGLSLGLTRAGFDVLGVENNSDAVATHVGIAARANSPM